MALLLFIILAKNFIQELYIIFFAVLVPPLAPTILGILYGDKSLSVNWSYPAGGVVQSFAITYSYSVSECRRSHDYKGHSSISNSIEKTARNYTLREIEEDSNYTIKIMAVSSAGNNTSLPYSITTNTTG